MTCYNTLHIYQRTYLTIPTLWQNFGVQLQGLKGQAEGKDIHIACTCSAHDKLCKLYRNYDMSRPSHRIAYLQNWCPLMKIILDEFITQLRNKKYKKRHGIKINLKNYDKLRISNISKSFV